MSCQHNTVSKCHSCCSPIVVQVPGLQGTGIVWENCTDEEKKDIAQTVITPVQDELNADLAKMQEGVDNAAASASAAKTSEENTKKLFTDSLVVSGYAAYEESWTLSEAVSTGTEISIPSGHEYVTGRYQLRVSYNGYVLSLGNGFTEVGEDNTFSSKFKLTFDAEANSQITVRIESLGKTIVDEIASESAAEAKAARDEVVTKKEDILSEIVQEGNTQVKRIQDGTDNVLVKDGTGCSEQFWTLTTDVLAGTDIIIPGSIVYVVGRHHLRVSWNGLMLYLGQNFVEMGDTDVSSNKIQLTFDAKAGDEMDVHITALGKGDVAEAISMAGEASAAVAELSRKVVYKEETE